MTKHFTMPKLSSGGKLPKQVEAKKRNACESAIGGANTYPAARRELSIGVCDIDSEWTRVSEFCGPKPSGYWACQRLFPSATHYLNYAKNRYANVLPVEDTRVKLQTDRFDANYCNETRASDFINANYITHGNRTVIATMAPLPNTFNDFWLMVWENVYFVYFSHV